MWGFIKPDPCQCGVCGSTDMKYLIFGNANYDKPDLPLKNLMICDKCDEGKSYLKRPWHMKSPLDYDWQYGPIPRVEDVPYDCVIILWSDKGYIGRVIPHGDNLNPLRWCDGSYHPNWGITPPEGWWTWYKKGGEKERPPEVKTWAEKYERPEQLAMESHVEECEQCRQIQELEMKQSCNSRLRMADMKDHSNEYCVNGQKLLKALYAMYAKDGS